MFLCTSKSNVHFQGHFSIIQESRKEKGVIFPRSLGVLIEHEIILLWTYVYIIHIDEVETPYYIL